MPAPRTYHLIPHTHWDREWYLTRAAFQARLFPVLDQVLTELERNPGARFVLDGQTVLLEDYLAMAPPQGRRVSARVATGALEIGPWYVLSDLQIPSAASLRRNLAEGAADAAHFGRRLDVMYSPDAFGHPPELPRLAVEAGIHRAVVRRGLGRPAGQDRDLFWWEAPTGERVLVHHLPAGGYDTGMVLSASPAEGLAEAWRTLRRELGRRAVTSEVAVFLGADHHAMVPDAGGLAMRLQALSPGDRVRVSGLTEFFDAVEAGNPVLPLIRGELRAADEHAWVLQGVLASRLRLKRRHAAAELILSKIATPLAARAAQQGGADREGLVRLAWRTLLQSQFHDTLAGTTSDAVQREQQVRLDAVEALSREIVIGSLHQLAGCDPDRCRERPEDYPSRLVAWNPSAAPVRRIAWAELAFFRRDILVGSPSGRTPAQGTGFQTIALLDEAGHRYPVQVLGVRPGRQRRDAQRHYPDQDEVDRAWVAFQGPKIAGSGLGSFIIRKDPAEPPATALTVGVNKLENADLAVRIHPTGRLTLQAKPAGARRSGLAALVDHQDLGDLYTTSIGLPSGTPVTPISRQVLARGPLVGAVETRSRLRSATGGTIAIRQVAVLHADSPILRLRIDLDNQAIDHRLRILFPVGPDDEVVAGTALGSVRRHPAPHGAAWHLEMPAATAPAHRFVTTGGLAILSEGAFEYEWNPGRALMLTLLRSVGELSRDDLPERPGHAAWPMSTPDAQEPGLHTIYLGIAPAGRAVEADLGAMERLWEEMFLPLQCLQVGAPLR